MKVVMLAEVELFRIGSAAGRSAFGSNRKLTQRHVVADGRPETLRGLIITLAVGAGEQEHHLAGLRQVDGYRFSAPPGVLIFDVDLQSVQYSQPYAACQIFPALESDGRYFRLDEIKV